MRRIVLVVLLISGFDVLGQSLDLWYSKSDTILHSISDISAFNEIVTRRQGYIKKNFLDTTFNLIRVRELYDTKTKKSKVVFDYVADEDKHYLFDLWTF